MTVFSIIKPTILKVLRRVSICEELGNCSRFNKNCENVLNSILQLRMMTSTVNNSSRCDIFCNRDRSSSYPLSLIQQYRSRDMVVKVISKCGKYRLAVATTTNTVIEAVERRHRLLNIECGVNNTSNLDIDLVNEVKILGSNITFSNLLASFLNGEERVAVTYDTYYCYRLTSTYDGCNNSNNGNKSPHGDKELVGSNSDVDNYVKSRVYSQGHGDEIANIAAKCVVESLAIGECRGYVKETKTIKRLTAGGSNNPRRNEESEAIKLPLNTRYAGHAYHSISGGSRQQLLPSPPPLRIIKQLRRQILNEVQNHNRQRQLREEKGGVQNNRENGIEKEAGVGEEGDDDADGFKTNDTSSGNSSDSDSSSCNSIISTRGNRIIIGDNYDDENNNVGAESEINRLVVQRVLYEHASPVISATRLSYANYLENVTQRLGVNEKSGAYEGNCPPPFRSHITPAPAIIEYLQEILDSNKDYRYGDGAGNGGATENVGSAYSHYRNFCFNITPHAAHHFSQSDGIPTAVLILTVVERVNNPNVNKEKNDGNDNNNNNKCGVKYRVCLSGGVMVQLIPPDDPCTGVTKCNVKGDDIEGISDNNSCIDNSEEMITRMQQMFDDIALFTPDVLINGRNSDERSNLNEFDGDDGINDKKKSNDNNNNKIKNSNTSKFAASVLSLLCRRNNGDNPYTNGTISESIEEVNDRKTVNGLLLQDLLSLATGDYVGAAAVATSDKVRNNATSAFDAMQAYENVIVSDNVKSFDGEENSYDRNKDSIGVRKKYGLGDYDGTGINHTLRVGKGEISDGDKSMGNNISDNRFTIALDLSTISRTAVDFYCRCGEKDDLLLGKIVSSMILSQLNDGIIGKSDDGKDNNSGRNDNEEQRRQGIQSLLNSYTNTTITCVFCNKEIVITKKDVTEYLQASTVENKNNGDNNENKK